MVGTSTAHQRHADWHVCQRLDREWSLNNVINERVFNDVLLVKIEVLVWQTIIMTCCWTASFKPLYQSANHWEKDIYACFCTERSVLNEDVFLVQSNPCCDVIISWLIPSLKKSASQLVVLITHKAINHMDPFGTYYVLYNPKVIQLGVACPLVN